MTKDETPELRQKKTKIFNYFGAPGAGKSTCAAAHFYKLKTLGSDVELVTEFAKDVLWDGAEEPFRNQAYIFGEQYYRLSRLVGKVDFIITDSPLPLSVCYDPNKKLSSHFEPFVMDVFNSFDNHNFFVERTVPYNSNGRRETEAESDEIAKAVKELLKKYKIPYIAIAPNPQKDFCLSVDLISVNGFPDVYGEGV